MSSRPSPDRRSRERRLAAVLLLALFALQTTVPLAAADFHPAGAPVAGCSCPVKMPCCLEGHCPLRAPRPAGAGTAIALLGCPGDAGNSALLPSLFQFPALLAARVELAHQEPFAGMLPARRFAACSTPSDPPLRPPRA